MGRRPKPKSKMAAYAISSVLGIVIGVLIYICLPVHDINKLLQITIYPKDNLSIEIVTADDAGFQRVPDNGADSHVPCGDFQIYQYRFTKNTYISLLPGFGAWPDSGYYLIKSGSNLNVRWNTYISKPLHTSTDQAISISWHNSKVLIKIIDDKPYFRCIK